MKKVLVSGGAGFIGSHLCERLLRDDYEVICIDNLITGRRENIQGFLNNSNFTFIEHDVTKEIPNVNNISFIFHLASPASPNKKSPLSYINHPIETMLANSIGTYNLLELARVSNSKFLFASSSEIYGDPLISPQEEDYFGNVNPNGPRAVYDEGKRFGEAITMAFVRKYNLDARIARIFNTYGPKMQKDDGRVVSNFVIQAIENNPITVFGEGMQTRSFCYVEDMVNGLIKLMFIEEARGKVLNLGNPDEYTIIEIANIIKETLASSSEITFEELPEDDPKVRKPNISKAKEIIGWEPKISFKEGLQKTIKYFKDY